MKNTPFVTITSVILTSLINLPAQPANLVEHLNVPPATDAPKPETFEGPTIQLALLLDTSNSMDGLIDQARSRLWKIVNEIGTAKHKGEVPQLQVALFQYGNDNLSREDDFVQLRCPLITDLDIISEQLFSLSTNGGQEYCGAVLRESLNQLDWQDSRKEDVLRVIVIAGNEPFNQGTEPFEEWTTNARKRNVLINTIFCGDIEQGRQTLWEAGATQTGGEFAAIDQDKSEVYVPTPFDEVLEKLNDALNGTYVGYGATGKIAAERQRAQDTSNRKLSISSFFSRAKTKASSNYSTSSWDLVSAFEKGTIKIQEIEKEDLPEELLELNLQELENYLTDLANERKSIQKEINEVSAQRKEFLADLENESNESDNDLDDALIEAMKKQAIAEGFSFS